MKKCILSALAGAAMLLLLALIANTRNAQGTEEYEHIDYVSAITEAESITACMGKNTNIVKRC